MTERGPGRGGEGERGGLALPNLPARFGPPPAAPSDWDAGHHGYRSPGT
jgi:hypothetical protein